MAVEVNCDLGRLWNLVKTHIAFRLALWRDDAGCHVQKRSEESGVETKGSARGCCHDLDERCRWSGLGSWIGGQQSQWDHREDWMGLEGEVTPRMNTGPRLQHLGRYQ